MALGVAALVIDIAGFSAGPASMTCGRLIVSCRSQHGRRLLRPRLSLAMAAPACCRFGFAAFGFVRRLDVPRFNRRRIPRDVLDKMAIHRPAQSTSSCETVWAIDWLLGKLGKGPRKRRLAAGSRRRAPVVSQDVV